MTSATMEEAIEAVRRLLDVALQEERREELEVEVRFGRLDHRNRFVAGVSHDLMDSMITRLHTNPAASIGEWREHEDYYFHKVDSACSGGVQRGTIRTRVTFDEFEFEVMSTHTMKQKIASVTVEGAIAVRIALTREVPVAAADVPMYVDTSWVRITNRKTIGWSRQPCRTADPLEMPYRYEFSLTWSGTTRSAAEVVKKTGSDSATYEFEIELNLTSDYARRHGAAYIARSLMMKACDVVDVHSLHGVWSNGV